MNTAFLGETSKGPTDLETSSEPVPAAQLSQHSTYQFLTSGTVWHSLAIVEFALNGVKYEDGRERRMISIAETNLNLKNFNRYFDYKITSKE